jgi:hypothetical protein
MVPLGDRAPDGSRAVGAWPAVSVETLHPAEIKPPVSRKSFHGMQSFRVVAAGGTAAPREPGLRGGPGPRGRRSVNGEQPGRTAK